MPELDLEAEIDLLPTEAGGRRRQIRSGYRPALWFGETSPTGEPALHSALLTLAEGDNLAPGERGKVRITPLAWETWPKVDSGTQFDLFDAGRQVGSGSFVSSPWDTASEEQVRRALHSALEEWVIERFSDRVTRSPRSGGKQRPDLLARFHDDAGAGHLLVGEVIGRRPMAEDVERLARIMSELGASLGLIVCLEDPPAHTWSAVYHQGKLQLPGGLWMPRIRLITTRELVRGDVDLLPAHTAPEELELVAA